METQAALRIRLSKEGRWAEATHFYARKIEELVSSGIKRSKAKVDAWTIMQAEFPPLLTDREQRKLEALKSGAPLPAEDEPTGDSALPLGMLIGTTDFDADLEWSYRHLGADVTPEEAPSGAAWALREYGRAAKTRGAYVTLCQKTFSKKGGDEPERNREDRSRQFKLLASLSREFSGL